jgi:glutamate carboxypeptidase
MTNPLDLPFDTDEMLAGLKTWIETESPTFDAAAVNRMMDLVQHELAPLGRARRWHGAQRHDRTDERVGDAVAERDARWRT